MKTEYPFILCIVAVVFAITSCNNDIDSVRETAAGETVSITFIRDKVTRTSLGEDFVPVWADGDEIWISDGTKSAKVVVSAEYAGKSYATLQVSGIDASKTIYASYPYSETTSVKDGYVVTTIPALQNGSFSEANIAVGSCEPGTDALVLHNSTAILKFEFSREDISSMELCSADMSVAGAYGISPSASDTSGHLWNGSKIHVDMSDVNGTAYISCIPGTLPSGSRITVVDYEGRMGYIPISAENKLKMGVVYDIGGIDDRIQFDSQPAVDLSSEGTANCYIIESPGCYRLKVCQGNSADEVGKVATGDVLWETCNSSTAPERFSIIKESAFDRGYLYLRVSDDAPDCNALAGVRGVDGTILWSWHLWMLKGGVRDQVWSDGTDKFSGAVMMDRNLGALSSGIDILSYGFLYQWGRKDPFTGSAKLKSASGMKLAGIQMTYTDKNNTRGTVEYTVSHPTTRIRSAESDGDWLVEPDATLWSAKEKTKYDPCPPGYHIPYESAYQGISIEESKWVSSDSEAGCIIQIGSESVCFPAAGYRYYSSKITSTSGLSYIGSRCYSWCGPYGWRCYEVSAGLRTSLEHGDAVSVRCQKNNSGPLATVAVKVKTSNPPYIINAPVLSGSGYPSAMISWGDNSEIEEYSFSSENSHLFKETGEYTVNISGYSLTKLKIKNISDVESLNLTDFR